jgi:hypothetical protein
MRDFNEVIILAADVDRMVRAPASRAQAEDRAAVLNAQSFAWAMETAVSQASGSEVGNAQLKLLMDVAAAAHREANRKLRKSIAIELRS